MGIDAQILIRRGERTSLFEEIDKCWFASGRESYTHSHFKLSPRSLVCPTCNHECANIGGGGSKAFHYCHGCGTNYVTSGSKVYKGEDLFKITDEIRQGTAEPYFDGKDFPQFYMES